MKKFFALFAIAVFTLSINAQKIATGYHSLVIDGDGSLWAWGLNDSGQLGDGTTVDKKTPIKVMENVVQVAEGGYHTLAVKADGSLWAWGYNSYGQLGDGNMDYRKPTPIKIMDNVVQVAAGYSHTLVVKTDGSLWAWGYNSDGQLGDGTSGSDNNKATPVKIMDNVVQVAAGRYHTLAIKADGSLWAWGYNSDGQLGDGTSGSDNNKATPVKIMDNVAQVAAGTYSTFAIKADGSLWAWGANYNGTLGDGTTISKNIPVKVMEDVIMVTGGDRNSFFLKNDGTLWGCGHINYLGLMQSGANYYISTPIQIMKDVSQVVSKDNNTLCISTDGKVMVWGDNTYGQLGSAFIDYLIPTKVPMSGKTGFVAAGTNSSFVISTSGDLYGCGANEDGELGLGDCYSKANYSVISSNIVQVAAGDYHTLAIKADGSLWAWGYNGSGRLGDGTTDKKTVPVKVVEDVVQVAAGGYHTLAVKADGSLWVWGSNNSGQLGDGTTVGKKTPIKVMEKVVQVAAGGSHTLAVKEDGSLWAWGYNNYGQIGDGTSGSDNNKTTPVKIMDNVVQVAAGYYHTLAVKADGSLWAWGYNLYGQLGDGTSGSANSKVTPVKIMDNVSRVAAGYNHTLAIKADGSLWAWGYNGYGRLGDGTTDKKTVPVKVMEEVVQIAAGDYHTLAVKTDGSLWAWGSNYYGQLGQGTKGFSETPIQIMKINNSSSTTNISFDDLEVKRICVVNWDTNGDGELSKTEAAAVTDLGEVFKENKEINSFDELQYFTSVTKLNFGEFYNCSSLASIILPNSLRSTGQNVFCGCYALSHIGWPENDGFTLDFGIFQHCTFSSISLPSNLTSFSGGTFVQCYGLTEILVDDANPYYQTIDGVVYSKDRKTVVAYPNGKDLTEYTILSGVEEIGRDALGYCNKLVHLSIPASVNKLGNSCFESMSALKSLVIPEAVTEIPPYCCAWNYSLEEVNIPNNTTKIGRYAFAGNKIASIVLPSKIAEIEERAFAWNENLEKVVSKIENPFAIDETVFEVEEGVFTTATLYVPIGTKSKYQSTAGWNKFANIVEQQTSEDVAIEGVVYSIDPDTKTATVKQIVADRVDLVIPESVTYNDQDYTVTAVGSSIFNNGIYNYYIYSVEFPSTITSVETNAFAGTYLSMAIVWNSDVKLSLAHFDQFSANFILYVKRAGLAPSGIPIVVVNGVADEVTLKDGYVFNCPQEFTAKEISYTHNYKMETGAGECAGWETIALPFEVQTITHATKGELTPFALWTSDSSRKPFWLFSLSNKGFIKASVIEANTPYIISMPNNSSYSSSYNVSGEVTFSATNAKVSRTGDAYQNYPSYDGATLWPCYSVYNKSSNIYALNVTNDFFTYNGTEKAGSMFISNYRAVYPFEAAFWKSTAEARGINIVFADDGTTAVEDVLIQADEDRRIVIYSLNGHLVGTVKKQGFDQLWNSLPKGVYIVNGKKRIK